MKSKHFSVGGFGRGWGRTKKNKQTRDFETNAAAFDFETIGVVFKVHVFLRVQKKGSGWLAGLSNQKHKNKECKECSNKIGSS